MTLRIEKHKYKLEHLPEGKTIFDYPVNERKKYLDPNQDPNHPDLLRTDFTCQCHLNNPIKTAQDKVDSHQKIIKEQQTTITSQQSQLNQLIQHMTELTHQVNQLTTQLASKSALLDNNIK